MTTRKLIALALVLGLILPATAAAAPFKDANFSAKLASFAPLTGPCAPGAAYDPACDVDHDGDVDVIDVQLAAGHWNQSGAWTGDYWSLTGNADTVPGVHVMGTTDPVTLTIIVSGTPALRIGPGSGFGTTPNLIGGAPSNSTGAGVSASTVGGGSSNAINSSFATIGGGSSNTTTGSWATVGGGQNNEAGSQATVAGGKSNIASVLRATVGGGESNVASSNSATVSGGVGNSATASAATVGGGAGNDANGANATIGGGKYNQAMAAYATVAGGGPTDEGQPLTTNNQIYDDFGVISGGGGNRAGSPDGNTSNAAFATVGGGADNEASAAYATVPGGVAALASHHGELAYASGAFAATGDAQSSLFVLRNETSDAALTEMFLDGSSERITLASNQVMTFDILVVGGHRFSGSSAGYQVTGVIRNNAGATSFVGTPVKTVLGENVASWDVVVEADNTLDALIVKVQGSGGTTIRWVASVRTVEVGR